MRTWILSLALVLSAGALAFAQVQPEIEVRPAAVVLLPEVEEVPPPTTTTTAALPTTTTSLRPPPAPTYNGAPCVECISAPGIPAPPGGLANGEPMEPQETFVCWTPAGNRVEMEARYRDEVDPESCSETPPPSTTTTSTTLPEDRPASDANAADFEG